MTLKRILFTLGIILITAGLFGILKVAADRFSLDEAEGIVYDINDYVPNAEYDYNGEHHRVVVRSSYTVGLDKEQLSSLKPGNKVTLLVDKDSGQIRSADTSEAVEFALLFLVPGIILTLVGLKGLKGYRREFIDRYKAAFVYTCIMAAVSLCYSVYEEFIFKPDPATMFSGLGEGLIMLGLLVFSAITIVIVWVISLIVCSGNQKKS